MQTWGLASAKARLAASVESSNAHSVALMYWPETFSPKLSPRRNAERKAPWKTSWEPPAMDISVLCWSSGDLVSMCTTPLAVLGP